MAKKTVLEKENDKLSGQLRHRIAKNAAARMKNLDDQISALLENKVDEMVTSLCGFSQSWGKWEFRGHPEDTIIGKMLIEGAEKSAVKYFKENLSVVNINEMFSPKERNALLKQAKETYLGAFMEVIGNLAETQAREEAAKDAQALLDSVLEVAFDEAPPAKVGKEPPLPRCYSRVVSARVYKLLLKKLVDRGMWFQVDPMPGSKFEVYVKDEENEWLEEELGEISVRSAGE